MQERTEVTDFVRPWMCCNGVRRKSQISLRAVSYSCVTFQVK